MAKVSSIGKNTMVHCAPHSIPPEQPQFEQLLPHVKRNISFVFISEEPKEIYKIIVTNKVTAPCMGAFAPKDVTVSGDLYFTSGLTWIRR
jgi:large subunit ribosomal protein LP0